MKKLKQKVSAPHSQPFKRTCPCTILAPPFNFPDPPSRGNQNLPPPPPPPLKKGGSELCCSNILNVKFNETSGILQFYLIFESQNYYWMFWRDFQKAIKSEVYSSTNRPLFTGGQNSMLNWVLKLNPLNQKMKKTKTV